MTMYFQESVNVGNIATVADVLIANLRRQTGLRKWFGFNMQVFCDAGRSDVKDKIDSCGTVGCIAGWSSLCMYSDQIDALENGEDGEIKAQNWFASINHQWRAAEWLELENNMQDTLFYGKGGIKGLAEITPQDAIAALLLLKETGTVDWSWAQSNPWEDDGKWNTHGDKRIEMATDCRAALTKAQNDIVKLMGYRNDAFGHIDNAKYALEITMATLKQQQSIRETNRETVRTYQAFHFPSQSAMVGSYGDTE